MTFEKSQKGYLLLNEPYMFVFWEKYISVLGLIRIQSGFKHFGSRILGFQSGNNTNIYIHTIVCYVIFIPTEISKLIAADDGQSPLGVIQKSILIQ